MTGLELGLLLLIVLVIAGAWMDGRHWQGEQRKAEADLERTRYRTRGEISREKWGRK